MPAGVSVPSLARANASIALPLAEFVMVYTAPATPGVPAALGRAGEGGQPGGRGEPDGTYRRRAGSQGCALVHCSVMQHGSPSMTGHEALAAAIWFRS